MRFILIYDNVDIEIYGDDNSENVSTFFKNIIKLLKVSHHKSMEY